MFLLKLDILGGDRILKNNVAFKENLFQRRCSSSPIFPICVEQSDSIERVPVDCVHLDRTGM